jgi:hypothetical protein
MGLAQRDLREGACVSSAGLSEDPKEYRRRLEEQSEEELDAWMTELMRDISIRKGVLPVLEEFRTATGLDSGGIERIFTAGGGAPSTMGRTADGRLMLPAISLRHLVLGLRARSETAHAEIVDFLAAGFEEVVYI